MAIDKAGIVFALTILGIVIFKGEEVEAKRGCASFGHSCYGGMGKRSHIENANEQVLQDNANQDPVNPAIVFAGPNHAVLSNGVLSRPIGFNQLTPEQYEQMNRFLRTWIINYLRKDDIPEKK